MIRWMGKATSDVLDRDCPWLSLGELVDARKQRAGHVVVQFAVGRGFGMSIDLGDCEDCYDHEIDRRFRRRFGEFASAYEAAGLSQTTADALQLAALELREINC